MMMKNKNIIRLGFLLLIALCSSKTYPLELTSSFEVPYQTEYTIADLQGTWIRKQSNNTAWDNVELKVEGNQGKLLDPMEPNLKVGDIKWLGIEKSGVNTFSYQEIGSDRNYYTASIRFISANILEIKVIHGGKGNSQKWVRKGLIQSNPGDSDDITEVGLGALVKLKGKWKREKSNNPDNDGMVVEVEGVDGKIIEPASGGFAKGDIKWKRIKNIGPNKYVYSELGSDGTYYSAAMEQIGNDLIKINIGSAGNGNEQTWKRVSDSNSDTSGTIVLDCEGISTITVWKNTDAEVDYIVPNNCVIDITAALTIEAGVVIAFGADAGLGVYDNGSIQVSGNKNSPVVFKGKEAIKGYWRGVHVESKSIGNSIEHLVINHAGSKYVYCCGQVASLYLKDAYFSRIRDVELSNGQDLGIYMSRDVQIDELYNISIMTHLGYPLSVETNTLNLLKSPMNISTGNGNEKIFVRNGQIKEKTTWYRQDIPYLIDNVVDVKAPLSIQAGTQIEFAEKGGIGVYDAGSLKAQGTSEKPIVFRGKEDIQGYWRGIHIESNSLKNVISYSTIKNAGSNYVYCCNEPAGIFLKGNAKLSLTNSTISDSGGCGVITRMGATLTESDNTFDNNLEGNICYGKPQSLDKLIATKTTLVNTPRPVDYIVPVNQVTDVKAELIIEPGVVIEFEENSGIGFYDNGTLNAEGTLEKPIVFRGKEDIQGYWRGIHIESNSLKNVISYSIIKNAGSNYVYCCNEKTGILLKGNGRLSLTNSIISDSGGCAVNAIEGTNLTQNDNVFDNNLGGDICTGNLPPVELPCQISENTSLLDTPAEVDYVVPKDCIVDVTASLTIKEGVIIEFEENSGLLVRDGASLHSGGGGNAKVILRGTQNKQGFWKGIHLEGKYTNHYLFNSEIKNAGANVKAAVLLKSGTLEMSRSHISDSGGCGTYVEDGANLFPSNNTFSNNQAGDICEDDGQGMSDSFLKELPCQISEEIILKDTPSEIDYIVKCMVDITGSLVIEPGVAIEFAEGSGMIINGKKVFVASKGKPRRVVIKPSESKKEN